MNENVSSDFRARWTCSCTKALFHACPEAAGSGRKWPEVAGREGGGGERPPPLWWHLVTSKKGNQTSVITSRNWRDSRSIHSFIHPFIHQFIHPLIRWLILSYSWCYAPCRHDIKSYRIRFTLITRFHFQRLIHPSECSHFHVDSTFVSQSQIAQSQSSGFNRRLKSNQFWNSPTPSINQRDFIRAQHRIAVGCHLIPFWMIPPQFKSNSNQNPAFK